jgi:hypothetical protein
MSKENMIEKLEGLVEICKKIRVLEDEMTDLVQDCDMRAFWKKYSFIQGGYWHVNAGDSCNVRKEAERLISLCWT